MSRWKRALRPSLKFQAPLWNTRGPLITVGKILVHSLHYKGGQTGPEAGILPKVRALPILNLLGPSVGFTVFRVQDLDLDEEVTCR